MTIKSQPLDFAVSIIAGQLTRDEVERGESDPNYRLKIAESIAP